MNPKCIKNVALWTSFALSLQHALALQDPATKHSDPGTHLSTFSEEGQNHSNHKYTRLKNPKIPWSCMNLQQSSVVPPPWVQPTSEGIYSDQNNGSDRGVDLYETTLAPQRSSGTRRLIKRKHKRSSSPTSKKQPSSHNGKVDREAASSPRSNLQKCSAKTFSMHHNDSISSPCSHISSTTPPSARSARLISDPPLTSKNDRCLFAHQDWYGQYRRNRGPYGVMRKLYLESARRRKNAVIMYRPPPAVPLKDSQSLGDDNVDDADDDDDDSDDYEQQNGGLQGDPRLLEGGESDSSLSPSRGSGQGGHIQAQPENQRAQGRGDLNRSEEQTIDHEANDTGTEEGWTRHRSAGTATVQAARRPRVVILPHPVDIRRAGLIPKVRYNDASTSLRVHHATNVGFAWWVMTSFSVLFM